MSSVPAVYTALSDLFTGAFSAIVVGGETIPVQVIKAPGTVTTMNSVVLMIGKIVGQRSAGTQNRIRTTTRNIPFDTSQDEYTVEIFISVSRPGTDMDTTIAIADAVWDGARTAVEDSGNLVINGVYEALPTGEWSFDPTGDANGRYVTVAWGIDLTARD